MLMGARIGPQRLRRFNKNFISICSQHVQSFVDELVERHCLLRFLAVHEFCAHPWRGHLQNSDTAVSKQEALRQRIGVERSLSSRVDSRHSQGHEPKYRSVVKNYSTTAFELIH